MHTKELLAKIGRLEFINDQVVAELRQVDTLLRSIGFAEGLKSLKGAAQEIFEQERKDKSLG